MNKLTVLSLGLLSATGLGLSSANANVKLVLDESTTLGMVADSTYNLSENLIEVSLDRPVLCNRASGYQASGATKLKVFDPNLEMKGGFTGSDGIYLTSANYQVNNGFFHLDTDNPFKALCVSADVGSFDLIFKAPFEDVSIATARVEYVGLPTIVSPGQILEYDIKFSNNSGATVNFDLLEYWPQRADFDAYITAGSNTRVCNNSNQNVNCAVTNPESGQMKNITLHNGGELVVHATQQVSMNAMQGSELDFMAAIFMKQSNGDFKPREFTEDPTPHDPHLVSHTASVQNNIPPTIEWVTGSEPNSLTTFYEDEMPAKVFEIEFGDNETLADNLTVNVTYSIPNIISVTEGSFTWAGLNGRKTLSVLPLADAYTGNDPVQVTVKVTDAAGGEASKTFDVHVTPVNDAPTFAMNCAELTINEQTGVMSCTSPIVNGGGNQIQGVWSDGDIIANFNPGTNEIHQSVSTYEVPKNRIVDNYGILDTSGTGSPVIINPNTGEITVITVAGQYGEATVDVRVKDNGGTTGPNGCGSAPSNPEHGCDVSEWQSLTIKTVAPMFNFSGVINGLGLGEFVYLKLFETSNGDVLQENQNITNSNGNSSLSFAFNYDAHSQFNYKVNVYTQSPNYDCDISSALSTDVDPENITGTITNNDINDIIVTCTEISN